MGDYVFWALAAVMVVASLRVVTTKNLVHAVVAAFVVLVATAVLFFMLNAEFLGVVQVLVYAGAVTILVLFVVMLTTAGPGYEIGYERTSKALMGLFATAFFGLLAFVSLGVNVQGQVLQVANVTDKLATRIFVDYLLPFEVASVVLLVALVGAVVLARRD